MARRARWQDEPCPVTGLKKGQCFLGDFKAAGIPTRKAYRHAMEILKKCEFGAFKGANKGTVATLLPQGIFSIEDDTGASTGATEGPSRGHQGATNIQGYKDTREQEEGLCPQLFPEKEPKAAKEPKANKSKAEVVDELAKAIWGEYPQIGRTRSSKSQLKEAIAKLSPMPSVSDVTTSLSLWKKCDQWTKQEGEFVPAVHRFVKDRKFDDPPQSAAAGPEPVIVAITGFSKAFDPLAPRTAPTASRAALQ